MKKAAQRQFSPTPPRQPRPSNAALKEALHDTTRFDGLNARHIAYVRALQHLASCACDLLGVIDDQANEMDPLVRNLLSQSLGQALAGVAAAGKVDQ